MRALELEHELSKDQILNLYLALAPYVGNLEGIRAASIAYFGKEPKRLSLAEAALPVALPQSPERRRVAIIVIDNESADVLARVGPADYSTKRGQGRSYDAGAPLAASTLKPLSTGSPSRTALFIRKV